MSDCGQVRELLESRETFSPAAPPAAVQAHLDQCPACRELWEFCSHGATATPGADVSHAIEQRLMGDLQAVRPLPGKATLALGFFAIFAIVSLALTAYGGWNGTAGMTWMQAAGLMAAIVAAAVVASIALSGEMAPGDRLGSQGWMVAGAAAALLLAVATLFPWQFNAGWLQGCRHCLQNGLFVAMPAAVLATALLRRGSPLSWGAVGAGAGFLAGLAGLATLHLGCSMHSAPHIAVGHLTAPLLCAAGGFVLGKTLPRLTASTRISDFTIG